jgi:hypothetical protein
LPIAAPQTPMGDVATLILEDHARIRRLFAGLETAGDDPRRLSAIWQELSGRLLAHLSAEEEICYLPFTAGLADGSLARAELIDQAGDICSAAAEARLQDAGSPLWWLAVRAARDTTDRHIDFIESRLLPGFTEQVAEQARRTLGDQWTGFTDAISRDSA